MLQKKDNQTPRRNPIALIENETFWKYNPTKRNLIKLDTYIAFGTIMHTPIMA